MPSPKGRFGKNLGLFQVLQCVKQGEQPGLRELCTAIHGFAAQLRTVREYYERSMQLLDPAIRAELFCAERPILAKEDDEAASYIAPDSRCVGSLIADGCQIEGSVEGSILFPGVKVGKGSTVKNCILFKNTVVEEGVTLGCVIADKDVRIRRGGTLIGHESYPLAVSKGSIV